MNDADEDESLSAMQHIGQVLVYLITPIFLVGASTLIGSDHLVGALIAGAGPMAINLAIMVFSYAKRQEEGAFLFPAKSSILEIVFCSLVTFGHGFALASVPEPGVTTYLMGAFASYSLFSGRCPESAVYRDNDQEFTFGSNHYQRPISNILTAVIMI